MRRQLRTALAGLMFVPMIGAADVTRGVNQFAELDHDSDGRLSAREATRCPALDFALADRDRDGYVSEAEFNYAMRRARSARVTDGIYRQPEAPPA
jgi:hypothetical protein